MPQFKNHNGDETIVNRLGFYSAILTSILTIVTFCIAFFTPPISGPFCREICIEYPFQEILSRFPRDYIWMYPAIILNIFFVVLMACIHQITPGRKKVFSQTGFSFALLSAAVLIINYFLQISVIQPSLINGESDGIALLTQYNPHGIFIVLEEIGYLMMSLAYLFMAFAFSKTIRLERAIRYIFIISFVLTVIALVYFSVFYGIHREYLFEVAVITIDWCVLLIAGILLSIIFKRAMKNEASSTAELKSL